jgi:hypothetical protein
MRPSDLGKAYIRRDTPAGKYIMTISNDELHLRLRFKKTVRGSERAEVLIVVGMDQKWASDFRRWNDAP